ncbi:MAG: hypothetical protein ACR2IV_08835 [Bryobacteraceae bacterium]
MTSSAILKRMDPGRQRANIQLAITGYTDHNRFIAISFAEQNPPDSETMGVH